MLNRLDREDRLLLMRYICSFAWADHKIRPEERELTHRFGELLGLDVEEMGQVEAWLESPPDVSPTSIPPEKRVVFVEVISSIILADGEISPEEQQLFQKLLP